MGAVGDSALTVLAVFPLYLCGKYDSNIVVRYFLIPGSYIVVMTFVEFHSVTDEIQ